jgi:hypothetical protein
MPSPAQTATEPNSFSGAALVSSLRGLVLHQLVVLGAHVLYLGGFQRAVFLGFGQRVAGDVGVDVHLEALVVLADDQAVADAVEIGPQKIQRLLVRCGGR